MAEICCDEITDRKRTSHRWACLDEEGIAPPEGRTNDATKDVATRNPQGRKLQSTSILQSCELVKHCTKPETILNATQDWEKFLHTEHVQQFSELTVGVLTRFSTPNQSVF